MRCQFSGSVAVWLFPGQQLSALPDCGVPVGCFGGVLGRFWHDKMHRRRPENGFGKNKNRKNKMKQTLKLRRWIKITMHRDRTRGPQGVFWGCFGLFPAPARV